MTKSQATKIANHLVSNVYVTVSGRMSGKTHGYYYAAKPGCRTVVDVGVYSAARSCRKERVEDMIVDLMNDEAPKWWSLDCKF